MFADDLAERVNRLEAARRSNEPEQEEGPQSSVSTLEIMDICQSQEVFRNRRCLSCRCQMFVWIEMSRRFSHITFGLCWQYSMSFLRAESYAYG